MQHVPLAEVEAAIATHAKHGQRHRRLPPPLVVYYVIALSLYRPYATREVLRCLLDGLRTLADAHAQPPCPVATKGPISRARTRLGAEVLATLCDRVLRPLAPPRLAGAWFHGYRVVAVDGTTLAVPDAAANREAFGCHGPGAFPLVRLAALVEVGTHAILRAAVDGDATHELVLAEQLTPALTPEMLLLEDRGFVGYGWWRQVRATGAQVLCRVRSNFPLPCRQVLPDGTFMSELRPPRGTEGPVLPVRVIDYAMPGVPGAEVRYRICTSLLDPTAGPADELAALYHERWEIETTYGEQKSRLLGGALAVLRSKTPALVRQELYGLLLAHYVVRAVAVDAASLAGEDPDRISFVHTVCVLRRHLPRLAGVFSPSAPPALVSRGPG
jgi:hypothetical protein